MNHAGPLPDAAGVTLSTGSTAGGLRHLSLRRGMVLLIIVSLLPILVLAVAQGLVRLEARRTAEISALSANAGALADSNRTILDGTRTLLAALAVNPAVSAGGRGCADALVRLQAASPAYANLLAYDADGWLRCAAVGPNVPWVVQERGWLTKVRNAQRVLVSDAIWGTFSHKREMLMVMPVRRDDGRFDGAVVAALDLGWLDGRLRARLTRPDTAVAVISDSGQLVMANRAIPPIDRKAPAGRVMRSRDADGVAWSYTLVPLVAAGPDQHGLTVVYATPDAPRFGLAWWQTLVDFMLPVLAILLASLAIWYGTQRLVVRWLAALQRLSLHFAAADYRHRGVSFAQAPREIRAVAASLYRMAGAVSERDRRLRHSLDHQRRLAREVHHRVKNNFQVVMSLLSLQSSRLPTGEAREAIDQARRRISALALVHRLIYDSGELASISSRTLLGSLCEQLRPPDTPGRNIQLDYHFDDVQLDIDSAVPLTLWMVETVHNALAHGFDGRFEGHVHARLAIDGSDATLVVSDDGVGFDPEAPPTEQPGAYGLRLIKALAAQLGGAAQFAARPHGGSEATLHFPLRQRAELLRPEPA